MSVVSNLLARTFLRLTGESGRLKYLDEFESSQYLTGEQLKELQFLRLSELLQYAYHHCEFYRNRFEEAGFDLVDLSERLVDLSSIPPLTKSDIQNHADSLRSNDPSLGLVTTNQTGGSTGQPIRFLVDQERLESRMAAMLRHDRWAAVDFGRRRAVVWGAPQDNPGGGLKTRMRRKILGEMLWLDTGNLTEQRMLAFDQQLRDFHPTTVICYARAMELLARFYQQRGIRPYSPHAIITSAEVLSPEGRATIEAVFRAPVFNRYGCREVSVIASECEQHDGLHVMAEGLFVEIVRNGKPVAEGETGEILITDLLNRAMPLIRYRIGDTARWATGDCPCGRSLPRLQSIDGRVTDFVVSADRRLVSGVFLATYVLAQRPSLGRVQLLQEKVGEVTFKIAPGVDFDEAQDRDYLEKEMRKHLGEDTRIHIEVVEQLPLEESGKFRFCKSRIDPFAMIENSRSSEKALS